MKEVIFNKPPVLDEHDKRITDLHSIVNILNVLVGELSLLCMSLDDDGAAPLIALEDEIAAIAKEMQVSQQIEPALKRLRQSEESVISTVLELAQTHQDPDFGQEVQDSLVNIKSVYRIVQKRCDELEARITNPDLWITISTEEFERQFREVFYAIEKNSKGRYRIFFNLARKNRGDYYIDLKIESSLKSGMLWIPLRLIDVLRDLAANARKYTQPGGDVALAIYQDESEIQMLVQDSGCGIPEDEIERVIEFGYRASNVRDRPTMGGGFGLTKAAWLIHHWGGTLTIASGIDEGTTMRLFVPAAK
jgi:hypothetical protein